MTETEKLPATLPGLREQKRQETRQRIVEASLRLFGAQGYDATTLDAIAATAGISRRTFFHYFKSKDDILLSLQAGIGDMLVAALADTPPGQSPIEAIRGAMQRTTARFSREELIAIDRLMLASETVQARKQANYMRDELTVFAALRQHWPKENPTALRLLAMQTIGMSRLSLEAWREEGGARPLSAVLDDMIGALGAISPRP